MAVKLTCLAPIPALIAGSFAHAADHTVSTPGELSAAINAAAPGDRILLTPGAYGMVDIRGAHHHSPGVVIASMDPAAKAVLTNVYLSDAGGFQFRDLRIEYGATKTPLSSYAVNILEARDIVLQRLEIVSAENGVAGDDAYGVNLRDSARIEIRENQIHDVYRGVAVFDSDDVEISRNRIARFGSDGVVARGSLRFSVLDNYFSDFAIIDPGVQHPDAIQLWSRDAPRANRDVVIRGNMIRRGAGDASQGIFVKTPEIATVNLCIEDNVIEQSMGQGVFVENVDGVAVRRNTVLPDDFRTDRPGVEVRGAATNATVSDNLAVAFRISSGVVAAGNVVVDYVNPWNADFVGNHVRAPANPVASRDFSAIGAAGAVGFVKDLWMGEAGGSAASLMPPAVIADLDFTTGVVDHAAEPTPIGQASTSGSRYYLTDPAATLSAAYDLSIDARAALSTAAAGWRLLAAVPNSYDVRIDRNRIRFSVWTQGGVSRLDGLSSALMDLAPHDIALRYKGSGGAMSIAVDGVEIARRSAPNGPVAYNPAQRLYVAGAPWGLYFGDGIERLKISR